MVEEFFKQLNEDINDIFVNDIVTNKAYVVPSRNDPTLTFPYGSEKKGKILETCVLMIDLRNSTRISRQLVKDKVRLGKIYSAFIYAMTAIADEFGYVRNIVGDRVMVVFEPNDCFVQAIECAAFMFTVTDRILRKAVNLSDFKIGIGIDYGEMLVLKTGIRKKHEEQSEYKNLIWVGNAANIASKLCDFANKYYNKIIYEITYEEEVGYNNNILRQPVSALQGLLNPNLMNYLAGNKNMMVRKTVNLEENEYNQKVQSDNGILLYERHKIDQIKKNSQCFTTLPILMSGKVYSEYRKSNPKSPYISKLSYKNYPNMPQTGSGVCGGILNNTDILKYLGVNRL